MRSGIRSGTATMRGCVRMQPDARREAACRLHDRLLIKKTTLPTDHDHGLPLPMKLQLYPSLRGAGKLNRRLEIPRDIENTVLRLSQWISKERPGQNPGRSLDWYRGRGRAPVASERMESEGPAGLCEPPTARPTKAGPARTRCPYRKLRTRPEPRSGHPAIARDAPRSASPGILCKLGLGLGFENDRHETRRVTPAPQSTRAGS